MEFFAINIFSLRKSKSYSQKDFAEIVGVSQKTITNWEKGFVPPDKQIAFIAKKIESHYNLDPDALGENGKYLLSKNIEDIIQARTLQETGKKKIFVPNSAVGADSSQSQRSYTNHEKEFLSRLRALNSGSSEVPIQENVLNGLLETISLLGVDSEMQRSLNTLIKTFRRHGND